MTQPLFAGLGGRKPRAIGSHHSHASKTEEWFTPPEIINALGGWQSFDLDPCAPVHQPYPTARRTFTKLDNGLLQDWGTGRVWLNPPYSVDLLFRFLGRMAAHNRGTALIFARTETDAFHQHVWGAASAVFFFHRRLNFHIGDPDAVTRKTGRRYELGERADFNSGAPSVLCAYGQDDMDILAAADLRGQFIPLRLPKSVLIEAISPTWREALNAFLAEQSGPVRLADIYVAFAKHPKARANPNYQAKIRQQLQEGAGRRVARGLWEKAS